MNDSMDDSVNGLPVRRLNANGLDVAYIEKGEGPLVMLLHGFPDTALGWQAVMDRLANAGFRAVAPFLRGYAPTALAPDGDYRMEALALDLIAQLEHFNRGEKAFVVGHDWGGAILQYAANLRPDRFDRIIMLCMPHLRRFMLSPTREQIRRSHYIFRFQVPRWAERKLPQDDFAWLKEHLLQRWSPGYSFSDAELQPLLSEFVKPERLKAALAYYRNIPRSLANRRRARTAFANVSVPTRLIYGADDGCFETGIYTQHEKRFTAGLDLVRAEGVGHFPQYENPDFLAAQITEFFSD